MGEITINEGNAEKALRVKKSILDKYSNNDEELENLETSLDYDFDQDFRLLYLKLGYYARAICDVAEKKSNDNHIRRKLAMNLAKNDGRILLSLVIQECSDRDWEFKQSHFEAFQNLRAREASENMHESAISPGM